MRIQIRLHDTADQLAKYGPARIMAAVFIAALLMQVRAVTYRAPLYRLTLAVISVGAGHA